LERAIAVNPNLATHYNVLGVLYRWRMLYALKRGTELAPLFREAEGLLVRASTLQPDYAWGWRNLNTVYLTYAAHLAGHGQDPRPMPEKATTADRTAMAINRLSPMSKEHLGEVHLASADYELKAGLNPAASVKKAEELFRQALSDMPVDDMDIAAQVAQG